jgi:hypothetical protein
LNFLQKNCGENFNISENNITGVELGQVTWVFDHKNGRFSEQHSKSRVTPQEEK